MEINQLHGFKISETIKNKRSIETLKIQLRNKKICIAKRFKQSSFYIQVDEQITFMKNLDKIFKLKYPSILSLDGYYLHNYEKILYPITYTKYFSNGSLEDLLEKLRQKKTLNRLNWTKTDNYITLLGISLGLNYLHSKGIVNNQLKPSNILFDDNYHPMICDIDLFNQTPTTFSKSYDICCFAQIIYELITNKSLFLASKKIISMQLNT